MSMAAVFGGGPAARRSSISSTPSEAGSLAAYARKAATPKSEVQVHLRHHYKTKTYTSGSPLQGEVTITTPRDIRFDSVEIILLGSSKTRTEGYSVPHESTHTFLKLPMPIPDSRYPVPRILEAGRTWTIPFNFVLPSFLTLSACHHRVESDRVRDHHLCLPPSMGLWARGSWERDDLAPNMTEVEYSIKARVWREPETGSGSGRRTKLMEAVKPIQVLPAFPEEAPLNITRHDEMYKMNKSKTLRKNLLSSKLGRLTASGHQPRAIMLQPDGRVSIGTTAQVDLTFEAVSADVQPPKITGVSTKIVAHTYYSAGPVSSLPNAGEWMRAGVGERRGVYSTSVALQSQHSHIGPWSTHPARRDSGYASEATPGTASCSSSSDEGDDNAAQQRRRRSGALAHLLLHKQNPTAGPAPSRRAPPTTVPVSHTATVQLPVDLPTARKAFVPSFHSCILSRVYTLHVSVRTEGASNATLSLDLPLQIGVEGAAAEEGGPGEGEALPSWEDALEDAAVDEFLRPRVVRVPSAEAREELSALPEYERL